MDSVKELIERSHAMAVEKGWWDGGKRSVADQTNNFHAEISESWEEYRRGRMETWYSPRSDNRPEFCDKPEGFWVELGDLCIRVADTLGAYNWIYSESPLDCQEDVDEVCQDIPALISMLHVMCCAMSIPESEECHTAWNEQADVILSAIIDLCFRFARKHNVNLWETIKEKMEYNKTRGHRHGGLVA